ncbi:hypothetical protein JHK82_028904 [Glycine max]|uniref:Uncharacterized protein n=2 Tax=Glycine subgen. Soja TaxID=1462606 RepID=A0A0R0I773_SOYBN|nr:hypothetical protein JHK87_028819 [Glycine soja]KAG4998126.1 hypothetical protein JHK85_029565 [Glycine max]KAG5004885.1 hypothetical protein JHK86_029024 [Glycine max]KAG5128069.1 hypothetical protein JHK82_028904 [Glycine max]KAG5152674.1 hypothetical protein JHK84_029146 [Glycine max]
MRISHPLVKLIRNLAHQQWSISFRHVLREGNSSADRLTRYDSTYEDSFYVWNNCPIILPLWSWLIR